jgi:hypothetical protein
MSPNEIYAVRSFNTGFSKLGGVVSDSVDIVGSMDGDTHDAYSLVTRHRKTDLASYDIAEETVITIESRAFGVIPSSLVSVVVLCTVCVIFSMIISPTLLSKLH